MASDNKPQNADSQPDNESAVVPINSEIEAFQASGPRYLRQQSGARVKRGLRWGLLAAGLLLLIGPLALWLNYQADYVVSRNALVKGHLAEIGSRLDGVVKSIAVNAGDRVDAGQVLAQLEDRHLLAEQQQQSARLAGLFQELAVEQATIDYEEQRLANRLEEATSTVAATEARLNAAKSRADDAGDFYVARKSLLDTGAISSETVRDAAAKQRTAEALLAAAEAEGAAVKSTERKVQLETRGLDIRRQRVGVLEASIAHAQAVLAEAESNLADTIIRAPTDGTVVRRIVQPGGSIEVGQPIMAFRLDVKPWIEAWVEEQHIAAVRVGSPATVALDSFPDAEFTGVVKSIGVTTDFELPDLTIAQPKTTRMRRKPVVDVIVELDNPPPGLLLGVSATVSIRRPMAEPVTND